MEPRFPLSLLERGTWPLTRLLFQAQERRGGVHYFPSQQPASVRGEDVLPMLGAFGLVLGAWHVIVPFIGWATLLALLSMTGGMVLAGLIGRRVPVYEIGLLGCGVLAWRQPGWPHAVAVGVIVLLLLNATAWLWLRARESVRGITLLLVALHLGPLGVGYFWSWPWAIGGWLAVGMLLVGNTLYPDAHWFGSARKTMPMGPREVCLTIDDGPTADTPVLLALLAAHDAQAIFFLIGDRAHQHPQFVKQIQAAGHLIGNHTQTHPAYTFWSYPPPRLQQEMADCQATLTPLLGYAPMLFRAPVGFRNPYCNVVAARLGLRVMGWQARGRDGVAVEVAAVVVRVRQNLGSGAVILLHQGLPHSLAVIQGVLVMLQAEGWKVKLPAALQAETPPANYKTESNPTAA